MLLIKLHYVYGSSLLTFWPNMGLPMYHDRASFLAKKCCILPVKVDFSGMKLTRIQIILSEDVACLGGQVSGFNSKFTTLALATFWLYPRVRTILRFHFADVGHGVRDGPVLTWALVTVIYNYRILGYKTPNERRSSSPSPSIFSELDKSCALTLLPNIPGWKALALPHQAVSPVLVFLLAKLQYH